jgi:hypothetical protein
MQQLLPDRYGALGQAHCDPEQITCGVVALRSQPDQRGTLSCKVPVSNLGN